MLNEFKKDRFVIHCKTADEWRLLIDYTYDNIEDMRDISREKWYSYYFGYDNGVCLRCADSGVCYSNYDHYVYHDLKIITYHEFQRGISKMLMPSKCDLMDFLI